MIVRARFKTGPVAGNYAMLISVIPHEQSPIMVVRHRSALYPERGFSGIRTACAFAGEPRVRRTGESMRTHPCLRNSVIW